MPVIQPIGETLVFSSPYLADDYVPTDFNDRLLMGIARTYVQGAQSMHEDLDYCAYVGGSGRRCAVGHMIVPDPELLDAVAVWDRDACAERRDSGAPHLVTRFPKSLGPTAPSRAQVHSLSEVQNAHDLALGIGPPAFRKAFASRVAEAPFEIPGAKVLLIALGAQAGGAQ